MVDNLKEREAFEAWANSTQPAYWATTAWARDAWEIWQGRAALAQAQSCVPALKATDQRVTFDTWLRSVCFQAPPAHAYDLARGAWIEADKQASADCEAMAEEIERLQKALAFWMPDVPPEGHPLYKRVADDVYLLVGCDGSNPEPSAFELGHVVLAESQQTLWAIELGHVVLAESQQTLWAIHVPGPDDYYPAPSKEAANHMVSKHNAAMTEWNKANPDTSGNRPPIEISLASAKKWPGSAADHAEEIAVFDYAAWGLASPQPQPAAHGAPALGDWRIDHSAGRPILVYKDCSVLESEQAYYVLELLKTALSSPQPQPVQPSEPITYTPGKWFDAATADLMQAFFEHRLPAIREAAKEHGYAIGLHGSMRRDLDLIAAPWRDDASDADTLAHAIAMAACGITRAGTYDWEQKPAGRVATCIPICWTHRHGVLSDGHIDLSVAPIAQAKPEQAAQPVPLTGAQIDPMYVARGKMKTVGEKDSYFWYAWGIEDAENHHGIAAPQPKD